MEKTRKTKTILRQGGQDLERVYLYNLRIADKDRKLLFSRSRFAAAENMGDVFMRHIGRYGFVLPFIRPDYRILDFPCGSGLFCELLSVLIKFGKLRYEGWDLDPATVTYAKKIYQSNKKKINFRIGDLTNFKLKKDYYNTICCIEGIEHISKKDQAKACRQFYLGLKIGGTLIMSSPEPESGCSGLNPKNKYHFHEMTKKDFFKLLATCFGNRQVEISSQTNLMTTGQRLLTYYAVCHKI